MTRKNRVDYENLRTTTHNLLVDILNDLCNVNIELSLEQPKIEFIRDVIHQIIQKLDKHYITLKK